MSTEQQQQKNGGTLYDAAINERRAFAEIIKQLLPLSSHHWRGLSPENITTIRTAIDSLFIIYDQLSDAQAEHEISKQQIAGLQKKCVELNNENLGLYETLERRNSETNFLIQKLEKLENKVVPFFPAAVIDSMQSEREYLFKRLLVAGISGRNLTDKIDQSIFTDQMYSVADAAINRIKKARE